MQVLSMPNWYTIKTPTAAAVQAAADGAVVAATEVLIYKEIGDDWWSSDPIAAARSQVGKPYDLWGVLGLGFKREWQDDESWATNPRTTKRLRALFSFLEA